MFKDPDKYYPVAITPSDATDLSLYEFRGFIPDTSGTVTIEPVGSTTPVAIPVIAAVEYHIGFDKINSTGTDSTVVIGLA